MCIIHTMHVRQLSLMVVYYQIYSTQYKLIAVFLSALVSLSHANYHESQTLISYSLVLFQSLVVSSGRFNWNRG
jgi:hypothetical protein